MTIPAPQPDGHVQGHYVEDPSAILTGPDDQYIPAFAKFLAKRYKSRSSHDYMDMARVLISRRKDLEGVQRDLGEAGSQGVDDLVSFAKQYQAPVQSAYQGKLTPPFGG